MLALSASLEVLVMSLETAAEDTLMPSLELLIYSSQYSRKLCLISRNLLLNNYGLVDDLS